MTVALKTMIENLDKARRAYESQLKALGKDAQKAVAETLAEFIPPGYVLRWTQYTPYFNDGEACTFSVHDPELKPLNADGETDRDEGFSISSALDRYGKPDETRSCERPDYSKGYGTGAKKTVSYVVSGFPVIDGYDKSKLEDLGKAWDALPEDLMEQAFGDHIEVVIKHGGAFSVDEYSHD